MTDLQMVCLFALEDMTLKELNDRYFDGGGIGYTKKVISGDGGPHEIIMKAMLKQFEKKYLDKLAKQREVEKSMSIGW